MRKSYTYHDDRLYVGHWNEKANDRAKPTQHNSNAKVEGTPENQWAKAVASFWYADGDILVAQVRAEPARPSSNWHAIAQPIDEDEHDAGEDEAVEPAAELVQELEGESQVDAGTIHVSASWCLARESWAINSAPTRTRNPRLPRSVAQKAARWN